MGLLLCFDTGLGGSEFHSCGWVEAVYKYKLSVFVVMGCLPNWLSSAQQQPFVVRMLGRSISWVRSRVIFALIFINRKH